MTVQRDIRDDLEPGSSDDLVALARRLQAQRPLPAPAFRGRLRRRLIAQTAPRGLGVRIAAFAGSGLGLLALAAAGAAGLGT
ncbi:hypothetical protein OM076_26560 [Solirubrobacter ginsenosidimutans]|uniref:Uncharacterized protein n=1 Tax=Solirubrobacter ginsenosidimutans TaxID=490573 RepID=A0A9X3S571_9ACTN|nr:hypothetical protein [Solirubrobacter ginsenosidimutans]MDA0163861.1 hypothetical protein [Solirubrobacter ginsenosidimutans]